MTLEELKELVHEMKTQDNAATGHPVFIVQEQRKIYGADLSYDFPWEWHSEDNEYRYADGEEIQEAIRDQIACEEGHGDPEAIEVLDRDPEDYEWTQMGYFEEWHYVCAHFTRKAAQRYIDGNKHNLKNPRVYVHSQYRCYEWNKLVEFLPEIVSRLDRYREALIESSQTFGRMRLAFDKDDSRRQDCLDLYSDLRELLDQTNDK